jgi:hypothetical protein
LKHLALNTYHGKAVADLPPLLSKSATSGDEEVLIDDLAVNDFLLLNIIRNVSLIFLTAALIFLLPVRLSFLIFLS